MITDRELIQAYYKGFTDELNDSSTIMLRAYKIGVNHAILGDEVKSFDSLTEEEILKIIKNGI